MEKIQAHVSGLERGVLIQTVQSNGGKFTFELEGVEVTLVEGTHLWSSIKAKRAVAQLAASSAAAAAAQ